MTTNSTPSPALSIIVPHRNHKNALPGLLDSVLAQSLRQVEVVVIDDCSDESCADVVEGYRGKGLDVRLFEQTERLYKINARLAGIEHARAEALMFADADDILWGTTALEEHLKIFHDRDTDIVHFRSVLINNDDTFRQYFIWADPFAPELHGNTIFNVWLAGNLEGSTIWNKMFSRGLLLDTIPAMRNTDIRYVDDLFLNVYLLFHARKYVGSDRVGYGYRHQDKRESNSFHRAAACLLATEVCAAYLRKHACPLEAIDLFEQKMAEFLCVAVGRGCLALPIGDDGIGHTDATVEALTSQVGAKELIKLLLLGNRQNAMKIQTIFNTIYRPFMNVSEFKK